MKFIVSEDFFNLVPDAVFGVVVVKGFDNSVNYDKINELFKNSLEEAQEKFLNVKIKEEAWIEPYREAFRSLGINPNKFMCSIEALMTRISKGYSIPSINPIVDLGNALSLKYHIPVGVHDISKFTNGEVMIRKATTDDVFVPFNSTEVEHADEREIVYASGNDIKTRRWTWRQGENSKVTENAKDFFIPIDGFVSNKEEVLKLQSDLVSVLHDELGLNVETGVVDKDHKEFIANL